MKKIIFPLAAIVFVGCSSNDDTILNPDDQSGELVEATIGFSTSEPSTRAYLGNVDDHLNEDGTYNIVQEFENNEIALITDYLGEHEFKVKIAGHDGTLNGHWGKDLSKPICATFPKIAKKAPVTVNNNQPTMYYTLVDPQVTRCRDDKDVSYDTSAALHFACTTTKRDALCFYNVCAYLYFYSTCATAKITSNQNIGGDITLTYTGEYATGSLDHATIQDLYPMMNISATSKEIHAEGVYISGHSNAFIEKENYPQGVQVYEYVVAFKPGRYIGGLNIIPQGQSNNVGKSLLQDYTFLPGGVYFLGCADKYQN